MSFFYVLYSCTNGRVQPSCYTCDTNEYCANGQCSINPITRLPECRWGAVFSSIIVHIWVWISPMYHCVYLYSLSSCVCVDVHLAGRGIAVSLWPTAPLPQGRADVSWHFYRDISCPLLKSLCTILMFVYACVFRHSLHSDPCAATVAAGSAGCRTVVLV